MIQSLQLLQVNTLQLEQLLKTEMELNPVLEMTEEEEEALEQEQEKEEKESDAETAEEELQVEEDGIDWEEYLEDGFDIGGRMSEESDPDEERYEPTAVHQVSLEEYLTRQLIEKKIPEERRLLVQLLINSLDDDGYLRISLEELAVLAQVSVFEVEEALNIIWQMDPPGLGARNLRECLMLQLRTKGLHDCLAMAIIRDAWDLFEKVKIPDIARQFNTDTRSIQEAINVLKTLNPRPGYEIVNDRSSIIIPDLIVEKIDGEFVVLLNDRNIPTLHINRSYANMLKRGSTAKKDVKKYIREKLNGATWLIRAIEQRKSTMIKVMYAIIDRQKDFFEKGPPNLNPLKLQDIADMVEMHISTVSRVTKNKYVQTIHGIFELKYFFTESMGQASSGDDVSSERIRNRISQLVESENKKKPFSDQKIADILSSEGYTVARRTVAKYREQLRILPARLRLKYD
jgi:RNA polymerase sigma-54 factor